MFGLKESHIEAMNNALPNMQALNK